MEVDKAQGKSRDSMKDSRKSSESRDLPQILNTGDWHTLRSNKPSPIRSELSAHPSGP